MRAHLDPEAVRQARIRAQVQTARGQRETGARGNRTAGRVAVRLTALPDLDGLTAADLALLTDHDRRERSLSRAAAALLAHDIAAIITPEPRAALIAGIGADARDYALRHRAQALMPQTDPDATQDAATLLDRLAIVRSNMTALWAERLPWRLAIEFAPDAKDPPEVLRGACERCLTTALHKGAA